MTTLVERVYHGVKQKNPNITVSAAVFANEENALTRRFQDWRRWLAMGIFDVVCPDGLFDRDGGISKADRSGRRQPHMPPVVSVWAGIGAYRVPAESAVEKINAARALRADGIILFSYDFTVVPHQTLNPAGDYLERVRRAAFDAPVATPRRGKV